MQLWPLILLVSQIKLQDLSQVNQNCKFTSMPQDAFTPSAVSSALHFQAVPASVGPQAASVPQVDNTKTVLKICAQLSHLAGGGAKIPNFLQQIHLDALADKDRENPHTKRHRLQTILLWKSLLEATFPNLPEGAHWHTDTVRTFARTFLRLHMSNIQVMSLISSRRLT